MSYPIVYILLLAAVANAAHYTGYYCGYTLSCGECIEKRVNKTEEVDKCLSKEVEVEVEENEGAAEGTQKRKNETKYFKYFCDSLLGFSVAMTSHSNSTCDEDSVLDYGPLHPQCETIEENSSAIRFVKGTPDNEYTLYHCAKEDFCAEDGIIDNCAAYSINAASKAGVCVNKDGYSYKVRDVQKGNELFHVAVFSSADCDVNDLVLQGEFWPDDNGCERLKVNFKYECKANSLSVGSCGYVPSLESCTESLTVISAVVDRCYMLSPPTSTKMVCNDSTVTTLTYENNNCTGDNETKIYGGTSKESFNGEDLGVQYLKLDEEYKLYGFTSMDNCESSTGEFNEIPLAFEAASFGHCKKGNSSIGSYRITEKGDKTYRIVLYNGDKCDSFIIFQGDMVLGGPCVEFKEILKITCPTAHQPPAQPGQPPAQPGQPPAQPGQPPAQPGQPPAQPGQPPAQPGQLDNETSTSTVLHTAAILAMSVMVVSVVMIV